MAANVRFERNLPESPKTLDQDMTLSIFQVQSLDKT